MPALSPGDKPVSRPVSRWLLSSVWPGQDGGHWGWPEQPSLASLILSQRPAPRPAESPEPELCPGYSLSLSLLPPSQIQSHFEPGPATRPRQAVRAHPVYLHLNHQYTEICIKMLFLRDPVAFRLTPHRRPHPRNWFSTASEVWKNIYSRLAQYWLEGSWALLAILTTQIRPGESIQMIENENKKSLNDFFDLETLTEKELTAVKV